MSRNEYANQRPSSVFQTTWWMSPRSHPFEWKE